MPACSTLTWYEDPAGWKRSLVKASNQSVDRVVWTGRAPSDGFTQFSFLAGTPDKPGELPFKALQTYADGTVVRWIGAPDSENPAAVAPRRAGCGSSRSPWTTA